MTTLQTWMKKEGLFDKDICRELTNKFGVDDPLNDFSKISKSEWAKFKKEMIHQRKMEIKDQKSIRKMQEKLAKIHKQWKSQQGKKYKNTASIKSKSTKNINNGIEKKSNLKPQKAKKQKTKSINPRFVELIISNWSRSTNINLNVIKYKNSSFIIMVLRYCNIFGFGEDGILTIKANKRHTLRSDKLYNFESIILKKKAVLTVDVWKTKSKLQEHTNLNGSGGCLLLRVCGNIIMNEGSKITVHSCGYPGGYGKGVKGGKGMGINEGGGAEDEEWRSSNGGKYKSKNIGNEKMSGTLCLGSGGGGKSDSGNVFHSGGSGGGILKIECHKLVFKGKGCVLSASGQSSINGGGGSGGALWLKCLSFVCKNGYLAECKIVNKGGKGDDDQDRIGKSIGEDGRIRIDVLSKNEQNKLKKIVKCDNVFYGNF